MKILILVLIIFAFQTGVDEQKSWKESKDFNIYQIRSRFFDLNIGLSDTIFYYEKYQDIFFHFAMGSYKMDVEGEISFEIDTLKSISNIRSLNNNSDFRYILPPKFDKYEFVLRSDTIDYIYRYSENKTKQYKAVLIKR